MSASNDNLNQMYQDSKAKHTALKRDIDNFYKKKSTNERKVYYELGNVENVIFYNKLIKILYFVILGVYILVGPFIAEQQYANPIVWAIILVYICIPFVLKYVVDLVFDWTNASNLTKTDMTDLDQPASSCFLLNSSTNLEENEPVQGGTGDVTAVAPLLVDKCYIRFEGEECKKHKDEGWSGWRLQTSFNDCPDCDGTTQKGCDEIKNQWSTYCETNTFNIFTTNSLPADNVCIVG